MKRSLFLMTMLLPLLACSDKAVETSETSALQLNDGCSETHADTALLAALEKQDLEAVKTSLRSCASTSMADYSALVGDVAGDIFTQTGIEGVHRADSIVIYLLENGADSAGRDYETGSPQVQGLIAVSMSTGNYDLVRYLLEKNYSVHGSAVWYAIASDQRGLYDTLIAQISSPDSIGDMGMAALASICRDIDQHPVLEPYFYDLLERGASPDFVMPIPFGSNTCASYAEAAYANTPLAFCAQSSFDSPVRARLAKALVAAGADPNRKICASTSEKGYTTPLEIARENDSPLRSYLESVAGAETLQVKN